MSSPHQNMEDAMAGLELVLTEAYPLVLTTISEERNDGIPLPPIASFDWEENPNKVSPAVWLLPVDEVDLEQKDRMWDNTILIYFFVTDRAKRMLTKRLLRYGDALTRMLQTPINRTLRGTVVSAKVVQLKYGATFSNRDQLFARDMEATVRLRMMKGDR